jgi:hypothetical protein
MRAQSLYNAPYYTILPYITIQHDTLQCNIMHYITQYNTNDTILYCLLCISLKYVIVRWFALILHHFPLNFTILHHITLHYNKYRILYNFSLNSFITLFCSIWLHITIDNTVLRHITQYCSKIHYIALQYN